MPSLRSIASFQKFNITFSKLPADSRFDKSLLIAADHSLYDRGKKSQVRFGGCKWLENLLSRSF
jgi:hypothetical protein